MAADVGATKTTAIFIHHTPLSLSAECEHKLSHPGKDSVQIGPDMLS